MEKLVEQYKEFLKQDLFYQIMQIFFKSYHLLFGIDYGFFKYRNNKKYRVLITDGTLIHCFLIALFCYYTFESSNAFVKFAFWVSIIQYIVGATILLMFKNGTTFGDFQSDVKEIDFQLRINSQVYKFELKLVITIMIILFLRSMTSFLYCTYRPEICLEPHWLNAISIGIFQTMDVMLITHSFVFYSINCRLTEQISLLKQTHKDFNSHVLSYKLIVDTTEKYKEAYDGVFMFSLMYIILQTMSVITDSVIQIGLGHGSYFRPEYFVVLLSLLAIFGPPICGGMLTAKVENIKINLHNDLISETDLVKRKEIVGFIRYIEARPMKFYVWGLLPLNASLFTIVLSFCITYLIVIVQFIFK